MKKPVIIVGAGISGSILAERFANHAKCEVILYEKRTHLGGNCYDYIDWRSQMLLHKYGPHYFRTSSKRLLEYLSRFSSWIQGDYVVKSFVSNNLYDFPINLNTLESVFSDNFTSASARKFLATLALNIKSPKNFKDYCLKRFGRKLYEMFFAGYTEKQWGKYASKLDPSVAERIPLRFTRDNRYVSEKYQLMPSKGYTEMILQMLSSTRIKIEYADYFKIKPNSNRSLLIYTGRLDEYFDFAYGKLPYRSLRFRNEYYHKEFFQPCVQINYPILDRKYTRSVEIKHVTKQKSKHTVVTYEYPCDSGEPFYPVPSSLSHKVKNMYNFRANDERKRGVFFCGRLAQYKYLNMDQCMVNALKLYNEVKRYV